jgi:hypothetical protein
MVYTIFQVDMADMQFSMVSHKSKNILEVMIRNFNSDCFWIGLADDFY